MKHRTTDVQRRTLMKHDHPQERYINLRCILANMLNIDHIKFKEVLCQANMHSSDDSHMSDDSHAKWSSLNGKRKRVICCSTSEWDFSLLNLDRRERSYPQEKL